MKFQIIKLAFPLILSQGIQTIMLLTDRYILSLKNPVYTAAATTGGFTALSFSLFFIHLLFFSTSLIAKKYGQSRFKDCHILVSQCFVLSTIFIPFLILLSTLGNYYFSFLGHPDDYRLIENVYFKIMMMTQILILYRTSIESYFLGTNQTQRILVANILAMITNILFSYLFVLGPYSELFLGASGAAYGTLCANLLSLIYLGKLYYSTVDRKKHKIVWRDLFYEGNWRQLLIQGGYAGFEKFTNSFCFVCFVNMFVFYGKEVSTAISIVFSWDQIAFLPLMGMYGAVISLYSRLLGQDDSKGAVDSFHFAVQLTFVLMFIFSIFFWFSATRLVEVFLGDHIAGLNQKIVYSYSVFFLQTTCLYIFANGAVFLYKAALRSSGYSGWCFRVSALIHIFLIIISYCGVYIFQIGPKVIWGIFMGMLVVLAVTFISKFYGTIRSVSNKSDMKRSILSE